MWWPLHTVLAESEVPGSATGQKPKFLRASRSSKRVTKAARHLGFLMPNLRGPRQRYRRFLSSVVTSKLLYAAPIWTPTMEPKSWKKLVALHRHSQLRVAYCYSTVSHEAAAVVSEIPPIKLLAKERLATDRGDSKEMTSATQIVEWQSEWNPSDNGRWTHHTGLKVHRRLVFTQLWWCDFLPYTGFNRAQMLQFLPAELPRAGIR